MTRSKSFEILFFNKDKKIPFRDCMLNTPSTINAIIRCQQLSNKRMRLFDLSY